MKERWYRRNWVKCLWIAIEHILLTAAILCGIFLVDQYNQGNLPVDVKEKFYANTEGFAQQIHMMSADILLGLGYEEWMQTENEDGTPRLLDMQEAGEDKEFSYRNTSGLAYRMEDLVDWATSSAYDEYEYMQSNILVCKKADGTYDYYYAQEFLNLIDKKSLKFVVDTSFGKEEAVISDIRGNIQHHVFEEGGDYGLQGVADKKGNIQYVSIWSYQGQSIEEKYPPDGAKNILEVVNENPTWNGRLSDAFAFLNEALNRISEASYENKLDEYTEGNTNLTYLYIDQEQKKVYTNKEAYASYKNYKDSLKEIQKTDSYVIVRPKRSECETTMQTDLGQWQEFVAGIAPQGLSDCIYAVSVDTNYPIEDELKSHSENYERYARWLIPAIVGMVISVIIWLVGLVILTLGAGYRQGVEELRFIWFDRIFTEVAAGSLFGIWIFATCAIVAIFDSYSIGLLPWVMLYLSGVFYALGSCALFLFGYLSLVRRIKGKTLWKSSLLRWLLKLVAKIWKKCRDFVEETGKHIGSTLKMILFFGGFLLLQLFLMVLTFSTGGFLLLLLGLDVFAFYYFIKEANGRQQILDGLKKITDGELAYKIPCEKLTGEQKTMAQAINSIGSGLDAAVENSLKNERMKTELITNVSHDIKTPLTSIINYIDLLKRENLTDAKIVGYLDVLNAKAQRLKILTEDVVEASKVSTGNITLEMTDLNFVEMLHQVIGEFQEKMEEKNLKLMVNLPEEPVVIHADGRRMWRVLANIFNNTAKYSMEGTRVYVDLKRKDGKVWFSLKNISAQPLNISADELTERFIRGDMSRSTEGSGLGLSIAKSLTQLQKGEFEVYLDGDLFKIVISFSEV